MNPNPVPKGGKGEEGGIMGRIGDEEGGGGMDGGREEGREGQGAGWGGER